MPVVCTYLNSLYSNIYFPVKFLLYYAQCYGTFKSAPVWHEHRFELWVLHFWLSSLQMFFKRWEMSKYVGSCHLQGRPKRSSKSLASVIANIWGMNQWMEENPCLFWFSYNTRNIFFAHTLILNPLWKPQLFLPILLSL